MGKDSKRIMTIKNRRKDRRTKTSLAITRIDHATRCFQGVGKDLDEQEGLIYKSLVLFAFSAYVPVNKHFEICARAIEGAKAEAARQKVLMEKIKKKGGE